METRYNTVYKNIGGVMKRYQLVSPDTMLKYSLLKYKDELNLPMYVEDISGQTNILSIVKADVSAPDVTVEYSLNNNTWQTLGTTSTTALTVNIPAYGRCYLRVETTTWSTDTSAAFHLISASGNHIFGGNIMSLLIASRFNTLESLSMQGHDRAFARLFNGNITLISVKRLQLPATTLSGRCYYDMFRACSNLVDAPELPSTTLINDCYNGMFRQSGIYVSPVLVAPTLASACYKDMFRNCTRINKIISYATDISATNCLQNWLYQASTAGDFYNLGGATYTTDASGIPSGWTEHTSL